MPARAPVRIGLTGGIGSGKSTVSRLLAARGAAIVDTDLIARQLTTPGGVAIAPIRAAFGDDMIAPDGALDRVRMRALAFTDAQARSQLEAILHPLIGQETERQAGLAASAPMIVFDVPLLVEGGRWVSRVDRVWVVDCTHETQIERVASRSGWDVDTVRGVISQQASRTRRRACADAVIFNDGIGLDALAAEIDFLWTESIAAAR